MTAIKILASRYIYTQIDTSATYPGCNSENESYLQDIIQATPPALDFVELMVNVFSFCCQILAVSLQYIEAADREFVAQLLDILDSCAAAALENISRDTQPFREGGNTSCVSTVILVCYLEILLKFSKLGNFVPNGYGGAEDWADCDLETNPLAPKTVKRFSTLMRTGVADYKALILKQLAVDIATETWRRTPQAFDFPINDYATNSTRNATQMLTSKTLLDWFPFRKVVNTFVSGFPQSLFPRHRWIRCSQSIVDVVLDYEESNVRSLTRVKPTKIENTDLNSGETLDSTKPVSSGSSFSSAWGYGKILLSQISYLNALSKLNPWVANQRREIVKDIWEFFLYTVVEYWTNNEQEFNALFIDSGFAHTSKDCVGGQALEDAHQKFYIQRRIGDAREEIRRIHLAKKELTHSRLRKENRPLGGALERILAAETIVTVQKHLCDYFDNAESMAKCAAQIKWFLYHSAAEKLFDLRNTNWSQKIFTGDIPSDYETDTVVNSLKDSLRKLSILEAGSLDPKFLKHLHEYTHWRIATECVNVMARIRLGKTVADEKTNWDKFEIPSELEQYTVIFTNLFKALEDILPNKSKRAAEYFYTYIETHKISHDELVHWWKSQAASEYSVVAVLGLIWHIEPSRTEAKLKAAAYQVWMCEVLRYLNAQ